MRDSIVPARAQCVAPFENELPFVQTLEKEFIFRSDSFLKMSESSDKFELVKRKDNLKRKRNDSRNEHIDANIRTIHGCDGLDGAKTDSRG